MIWREITQYSTQNQEISLQKRSIHSKKKTFPFFKPTISSFLLERKFPKTKTQMSETFFPVTG